MDDSYDSDMSNDNSRRINESHLPYVHSGFEPYYYSALADVTAVQPWTSDEDTKLQNCVQRYFEQLNVSPVNSIQDNQWGHIYNIFRSDIKEPNTERAVEDLRQRWNVLRTPRIRGAWLKEEDELLRELVSKGFKFWREVAMQIPGRTSKQCRERWQHNLQPSLLRSAFTAEEDRTLLQLQQQYGNRWATIGRELVGRSGQQIKSRFELLRRRLSSEGQIRDQDIEWQQAPKHHDNQADVHSEGTNSSNIQIANNMTTILREESDHLENTAFQQSIHSDAQPYSPATINDIIWTSQTSNSFDGSLHLPVQASSTSTLQNLHLTNNWQSGSGATVVVKGPLLTSSTSATRPEGALLKHSCNITDSCPSSHTLNQGAHDQHLVAAVAHDHIASDSNSQRDNSPSINQNSQFVNTHLDQGKFLVQTPVTNQLPNEVHDFTRNAYSHQSNSDDLTERESVILSQLDSEIFHLDQAHYSLEDSIHSAQNHARQSNCCNLHGSEAISNGRIEENTAYESHLQSVTSVPVEQQNLSQHLQKQYLYSQFGDHDYSDQARALPAVSLNIDSHFLKYVFQPEAKSQHSNNESSHENQDFQIAKPIDDDSLSQIQISNASYLKSNQSNNSTNYNTVFSRRSLIARSAFAYQNLTLPTHFNLPNDSQSRETPSNLTTSFNTTEVNTQPKQPAELTNSEISPNQTCIAATAHSHLRNSASSSSIGTVQSQHTVPDGSVSNESAPISADPEHLIVSVGVQEGFDKSEYPMSLSHDSSELFVLHDTLQDENQLPHLMQPSSIKGQWREDEDILLSHLVSKGYSSWKKMSLEMPGRNSKQCRERWINYLDPKNLRTRFSQEEDEKLLSLHAQLGNRWAQISRQLPGRSEQVVKGRFRTLTRPPQSVLMQPVHGTSLGPQIATINPQLNSNAANEFSQVSANCSAASTGFSHRSVAISSKVISNESQDIPDKPDIDRISEAKAPEMGDIFAQWTNNSNSPSSFSDVNMKNLQVEEQLPEVAYSLNVTGKDGLDTRNQSQAQKRVNSDTHILVNRHSRREVEQGHQQLQSNVVFSELEPEQGHQHGQVHGASLPEINVNNPIFAFNSNFNPNLQSNSNVVHVLPRKRGKNSNKRPRLNTYNLLQLYEERLGLLPNPNVRINMSYSPANNMLRSLSNIPADSSNILSNPAHPYHLPQQDNSNASLQLPQRSNQSQLFAPMLLSQIQSGRIAHRNSCISLDSNNSIIDCPGATSTTSQQQKFQSSHGFGEVSVNQFFHDEEQLQKTSNRLRESIVSKSINELSAPASIASNPAVDSQHQLIPVETPLHRPSPLLPIPYQSQELEQSMQHALFTHPIVAAFQQQHQNQGQTVPMPTNYIIQSGQNHSIGFDERLSALQARPPPPIQQHLHSFSNHLAMQSNLSAQLYQQHQDPYYVPFNHMPIRSDFIIPSVTPNLSNHHSHAPKENEIKASLETSSALTKINSELSINGYPEK